MIRCADALDTKRHDAQPTYTCKIKKTKDGVIQTTLLGSHKELHLHTSETVHNTKTPDIDIGGKSWRLQILSNLTYIEL